MRCTCSIVLSSYHPSRCRRRSRVSRARTASTPPTSITSFLRPSNTIRSITYSTFNACTLHPFCSSWTIALIPGASIPCRIWLVLARTFNAKVAEVCSLSSSSNSMSTFISFLMWCDSGFLASRSNRRIAVCSLFGSSICSTSARIPVCSLSGVVAIVPVRRFPGLCPFDGELRRARGDLRPTVARDRGDEASSSEDESSASESTRTARRMPGFLAFLLATSRARTGTLFLVRAIALPPWPVGKKSGVYDENSRFRRKPQRDSECVSRL